MSPPIKIYLVIDNYVQHPCLGLGFVYKSYADACDLIEQDDEERFHGPYEYILVNKNKEKGKKAI